MAPNLSRRGNISNNWSDKILAELPDRPNNSRFWEDGLNTGVRVLQDGRLDIKLHQDRSNLAALGKELLKHGHRVRLATHAAFKDFVNENGLEFFSIGGDPGELMAFMVKNPGLLPDLRAIRDGDIQRRRQEMKTIFSGCWRACFEMGDGTESPEISHEPWSEAGDYRTRPFVADAIIANPPSYAHISCAERLGIPLHLMFTMPWSPTQYFPHPLANVRARNTKPSVANFASYAIVEMMIWEGLGDLLNKFRKKELGLDPLDGMRAPSLIHKLQIAYSYLWSPSFLAKPADWTDNIDVCGFSFLPAEHDYRPPEDLETFLKKGSTPIYIGFGSIVVDDAAKLTRVVFDAVKATGCRAVVGKGWGNIGSEEVDVPEDIYLLGNCPHDWLFQHVSCVVHHGGAGTTATGLAQGRPTVVIPFFGDQPFWGSIIARAGAGPDPVPYKQLTTEKLTSAIKHALEPSTMERAEEIGKNMKAETGVLNAAHNFHRHLDLDNLRCWVCPHRPAVWAIRNSKIRLSAFAATTLVEAGLLKPYNVELHRPREYDTRRDPRGPLSASVEVLYGAISAFISNIRDVPAGLYTTTRDTVLAHHCNQDAHCPPPGYEGDQHDSNASPEDTDAEPETAGNAADITRELTTTSSSRRERKPRRSERFLDASYKVGQVGKHVVDWAIMLPGDITLSLSRGFHNAPKLYHDRTVTGFPKVIGTRSGFYAARKEFTDGFYNGITGLIVQPHQGFQKSGSTGLLKGVGKGFGGVILKPVAGIWGLAGYPLDGIHKSLRKSLSRSSTKQLIAGHIAQGIEAMCDSSTEDRAAVIQKWNELNRRA